MCGRFALYAPGERIARQFGLEAVPELAPRYNLSPSQSLTVITEGRGHDRQCHAMRWGLVPGWSKTPSVPYSTINARAETVAEKPVFRSAFRRRRCLIPASGWYEWQPAVGGRQPWFMHPRRGQGLLAFGGVWEHWAGDGAEPFDSVAIIVTAAAPSLQPIHDRMPVLIEAPDYEAWLDHENHDAARLQTLMQPADAASVQALRVSTHVNSPKHDDPRCIEPLDAGDRRPAALDAD